MQKVKNSIGESIRKLRKSQEISKSELAEITGISSSHMNKIELGIRNPRACLKNKNCTKRMFYFPFS